MADNPKPAPMSSAEFRTLRESCGLTQSAAAELLGVTIRGLQRWEEGTRGVSDDVASNILWWDGLIRERVTAILTPLAAQRAAETVHLTRYRTLAAYEAGEPEHAAAGLPFACWPSVLCRLTDGLARLRIRYAVSWDDAAVEAPGRDAEAA